MGLIFSILFSIFSLHSEKYVIESSIIEFYSYAPLEEIEGSNTKSVGALDIETGEFLIKIPVTEFQFPNKLMQKHFNDSYLETDKYPECIFKGKINDGIANGEITLHGETKKISIPIILNKSKEKVTIDTEFKILLKDYQIKVPRLLFQNIAEEIEIKVNSTFTKYLK